MSNHRRPPRGYYDDQLHPVHGGYYDPYEEPRLNTEIVETEKDYFSGLYDHEGNPLYKQKPRMGFIK